MTLLEARVAFTSCLGELLAFAKTSGYSLLLDEAKRHPMVAQWNATHCRVMLAGRRCEKTPAEHPPAGHKFRPVGIAKSVHIQGLAVDLYVIHGGAIVNSPSGGYSVLGHYWKSLHELARWGGDFEGFPDLGHFSFTWDGRS